MPPAPGSGCDRGEVEVERDSSFSRLWLRSLTFTDFAFKYDHVSMLLGPSHSSHRALMSEGPAASHIHPWVLLRGLSWRLGGERTEVAYGPWARARPTGRFSHGGKRGAVRAGRPRGGACFTSESVQGGSAARWHRGGAEWKVAGAEGLCRLVDLGQGSDAG